MMRFIQKLLAAVPTAVIGLLIGCAGIATASTITVMQGSDTLTSSRAVINTNFANLNSDKWENGQTRSNISLGQLTVGSLIGTSTASTTQISALKAWFGATGTTSIDSAGKLTAPYASTTNITATLASTTGLNISSISNSLLKTVNGVVTAAVVGTDYSTASYPFAVAGNATSTLTQFNGGLTSYASTTIGAGTATGGLTVSGNATTTGTAYFSGSVGIGTSSPNTTLTVSGSGPNGINLDNDQSAGINSSRLFFSSSLGSFSIFDTVGILVISSGASAGVSNGTSQVQLSTSQLYLASNIKLGIGTSSPGTPLSVSGDSVIAGQETARIFSATSTLAASTFPYASTTAISATTASSTNLIVSGIPNKILGTTNGVVTGVTLGTGLSYAATTLSNTGVTSLIGGTNIAVSASTGAVTVTGIGYPFTYATTFNTLSAGTSTPLWLQGATYSLFASSTSILDYASTTALTITGSLYVPQSASSTLRVTGQTAVQTGAASSSMQYYDGTGQRGQYDISDTGFTFINYPTNGTGTTTIIRKLGSRGRDFTGGNCTSVPGTANVQMGNGTASTTMLTSSLTLTTAQTAFSTNNKFNSFNTMFFALGTFSSTATTTVTCAYDFRYTY